MIESDDVKWMMRVLMLGGMAIGAIIVGAIWIIVSIF